MLALGSSRSRQDMQAVIVAEEAPRCLVFALESLFSVADQNRDDPSSGPSGEGEGA